MRYIHDYITAGLTYEEAVQQDEADKNTQTEYAKLCP